MRSACLILFYDTEKPETSLPLMVARANIEPEKAGRFLDKIAAKLGRQDVKKIVVLDDNSENINYLQNLYAQFAKKHNLKINWAIVEIDVKEFEDKKTPSFLIVFYSTPLFSEDKLDLSVEPIAAVFRIDGAVNSIIIQKLISDLNAKGIPVVYYEIHLDSDELFAYYSKRNERILSDINYCLDCLKSEAGDCWLCHRTYAKRFAKKLLQKGITEFHYFRFDNQGIS